MAGYEELDVDGLEGRFDGLHGLCFDVGDEDAGNLMILEVNHEKSIIFVSKFSIEVLKM